MARLLLLLILPLLWLHAGKLSVTVKRGVENAEPYAMMHIRSEEPFVCTFTTGESGEAETFTCLFDQGPLEEMNDVKNEFFTVAFSDHLGRFRMDGRFLQKGRLLKIPAPLSSRSVMPAQPAAMSDHWMAVGYKSVPPFLKEEEHDKASLDFPVDFSDYRFPSVGPVDLAGNPVQMRQTDDILLYTAMKNKFEHGKFESAYNDAQEGLERFSESIFLSDFLLYKIKSMMEMDLKEYSDTIIKDGKYFIRHYTSDEALPEVLLMLARVYSAMGFMSDANYFFDRLIKEHAGDRFANLGLIYLGDQLFATGQSSEALKRYEEALYAAKDLDVASLAAYKLGQRYFDIGKDQEGTSYFEKILAKNPEYLLKDFDEAYQTAKLLRTHDAFAPALKLELRLFGKLHKMDDLYEPVMYEIAQLYEKTDDAEEALAWYNRYIDTFPYGTYADDVRKALDRLFAYSQEQNRSKMLQVYDRLIDKYDTQTVGAQALLAKARLLLENNQSGEVLQMEPELEKLSGEEEKKTARQLLEEAAAKSFKHACRLQRCRDAVSVFERFSVQPDSQEEVFLFGCLSGFAAYDQAEQIAKGHLGDQSLRQRAAWSCRLMHLLVQKKAMAEALELSNDIETLEKSGMATDACPQKAWDLVPVYAGLNRYAELVGQIRRLAEAHADSLRMAPMYQLGAEAAKKESDRLQEIWMLERLIALQKRKESFVYSPQAEFGLMRLLKEEGKKQAALEIAKEMQGLSLAGEERAMWRYQLAQLYQQNGQKQEAVKQYEACSTSRDGGAWGGLCTDALKLLVP